MIISCTAMNKNTGPDNLTDALGRLSRAIDAASDPQESGAIILARVVRGFSADSLPEEWGKRLADHWYALPLDNDDANCLCQRENSLPVSPFLEVRGALNRSMFIRQVNSELLRIGRNGGALTVLGASVVHKKSPGSGQGKAFYAQLDSTLGDILLSMLESCDSLGVIRDGEYGCCLPGIGQLGARHFAEKAQTAFKKAAQTLFPASGLDTGQGATCAIGIVNLMQGEGGNGADLVRRAANTLEVALSKSGGHIHQESTYTPLDGATLVQSSEKRFLFFGGDQS